MSGETFNLWKTILEYWGQNFFEDTARNIIHVEHRRIWRSLKQFATNSSGRDKHSLPQEVQSQISPRSPRYHQSNKPIILICEFVEISIYPSPRFRSWPRRNQRFFFLATSQLAFSPLRGSLVAISCGENQERKTFKVPLTPKFFLSRQTSSFCSDHIGEKIIVVRFFLDFLWIFKIRKRRATVVHRRVSRRMGRVGLWRQPGKPCSLERRDIRGQRGSDCSASEEKKYYNVVLRIAVMWLIWLSVYLYTTYLSLAIKLPFRENTTGQVGTDQAIVASNNTLWMPWWGLLTYDRSVILFYQSCDHNSYLPWTSEYSLAETGNLCYMAVFWLSAVRIFSFSRCLLAKRSEVLRSRSASKYSDPIPWTG